MFGLNQAVSIRERLGAVKLRSYTVILSVSIILGFAIFLVVAVTENPFILTGRFLSSLRIASEGPGIGAVSGEIEGYKTVGVRTGVWNNGQAAWWDLHFIDHFRWFGLPQRARGWQPQQPVYFSHVTHVQKSRIECQYCHWTVTKAPFSALPEVQSCVGCHNRSTGTNLGQNEGQKAAVAEIARYDEQGRPIPWVKVHVMPDHVRFNHKRHVKAGTGCQECHGQIPEMSVVQRVSSMKMGWCLDCHRFKGASVDCMTCHH